MIAGTHVMWMAMLTYTLHEYEVELVGQSHR